MQQPENLASLVCATILLGLAGPARAQVTYHPVELINPDGLTESQNPGFGGTIAAIGDLDGDGVPDFAVGASGEGRIFVFNGADRTLLLTIDSPIEAGGPISNPVGLGDIDRDGVPDILAGRYGGPAFVFSGAHGAVLLTVANPEAPPFKFSNHWARIGDVDGDGVPDFAGSVEGQNSGPSPDQGRVFVFSGYDAHVLLTLDDPFDQQMQNCCFNRGAVFGLGVAGIGDVDGDGVPDIAVGAPGQTLLHPEDDFLRYQGEAFIFSGADASLLLVLDDPDPETASEFGSVLEGPGDLTGDGVPDLVVGAPVHHVGPSSLEEEGQAYVFSGFDGTFVRTLNPAPADRAYFGWSIAAVGDLNGDGAFDLLVGAPRQRVGGQPSVGMAFVLSGVDGSVLHALDNPSPVPQAEFGFAVADAGDLNGDALRDLLVGVAPCCDPDPGRVYLFLSSNTPSGADVVIDPIDTTTGTTPVRLTFAAILGEGGTTGLATSQTGPASPAGFALGDPPTYYEITTTAAFTPPVTVCIDYTGVAYSDESQLHLVHFEAGVWTDRTTSLDTTANIICASVGSLSPFVILEPSNEDPIAVAGTAQTLECLALAGTSVTLDGSGSYDPDGQSLSYVWTGPFPEGGGTVSGVGPTVTLPPGLHTVTLTVDDGQGGTASADVAITVRDTIAPMLDVALSPNVLWPPNNTLASIAADVQAIDACSATTLVTLVSIANSEPGSPSDIQGAVAGTDDRSFLLRASRDGSGSGRSYVVTYEAVDAAGNRTVAAATVAVPHDRR